MSEIKTTRLGVQRDAIAPDGSDVRILLRLGKGSMAHFELPPNQTSVAMAHHEIEEIWFILNGRGEMWRKDAEKEIIVPLDAGVCLTIPAKTHFQFRSFGYEPLSAIGVTMPPWEDETKDGKSQAYAVEGIWKATVISGNS